MKKSVFFFVLGKAVQYRENVVYAFLHFSCNSKQSPDKQQSCICGGKFVLRNIMNVNKGLPPHARGKGNRKSKRHLRIGITPACAGKTNCQSAHLSNIRDHPRMRGENFIYHCRRAARSGSPPHARGKLEAEAEQCSEQGITPACAGKTSLLQPEDDRTWDHPRMRGENKNDDIASGVKWGSPPHARGKPAHYDSVAVGQGISPACAGKT